jgi:hypothetical protein
MYQYKNKKTERIEPVTLSELKISENDIEELLRTNIDIICEDEESMLIVGRQVKNEKNGRSDLTAIDNDGSLVLIEIKRDKKDIGNRKEAFEFQAIRYAASYATIDSVDKLVKNVYAHYIEKYRTEFELGELTSFELGLRKLHDFLRVNDAEKSFNEKQRIILVASDFDAQTLSAVTWLNSNGVDISCHRIVPYKIDSSIYFDIDKILPLAAKEDYYVNILERREIERLNLDKKITRRSLPKIDQMLKWEVVKSGDVLLAKGRTETAVLQKDGNVIVEGKKKTIALWLKELYGWSSIQTYVFAIHQTSGKSLSDIRDEYMLSHEE